MPRTRFVAISGTLLSCGDALAQSRGGGAGHSSGLLFGFIAMLALGAVLASVSRSMKTFFQSLAGLTLIACISIGGSELAARFGIVRAERTFILAVALFVALLVGPTLVLMFLQRRNSK
jgi:hypothetical protein